MSGNHDVPQPLAWITRFAAANDAIGRLVTAMARQITSPGPEADRAVALAKIAYETATGSPADGALLATYHAEAEALARRSGRGCAAAPAHDPAEAYRVDRYDWIESGV